MPVGIWYPNRGTEAPFEPDIFPNLQGLLWTVRKYPIWSTSIQESFGQVETRVGFVSYPRWRWVLDYEVLRSSTLEQELQGLAGFFCSHGGSARSFLFEDRDDCELAQEWIGTGDGVETEFQLVRSWQNLFFEPICELNGDLALFLDGVATSAWTISASGLITFTAPPGDGAVVTANGYFFRRVRFVQDETEFHNFMYQLWEAQQVELISVKGES